MNLFGIRMPRSNLNAGNRRLHVRARIWMLVMHFLNWMTQIQNPLTEKLNRMTRELIWIVIFTARQNPANLNEIKMNLIVKFANLAGKSYIFKELLQVCNSSLVYSNFIKSNIVFWKEWNQNHWNWLSIVLILWSFLKRGHCQFSLHLFSWHFSQG